jgi:hypothetical protein
VVAVLLCKSVALQVTVVAPSANSDPDAGLHATFAIGPSTASVAVGTEYVTVEPLGAFASTVTFAGTPEKTGGVVSVKLTVTVNDAVPRFPCASVALQVTVVVPTGNKAPDAGMQLVGNWPSTLSTALAV